MNSSIAIGRRSFLGRAAAVLAGAGTTTPVMLTAALAAPEEDPVLVDAGRRLDGLVQTYNAAIAKLAEVKALARSLVPEIPDDIVCNSTFWSGCTYEETDVDGKSLPIELVAGDDGKMLGLRPKKIVDSTALKNAIGAKRIPCDGRTSWGKMVKRMIATAERYEADRAAAIERAGYPEAHEAACCAWQAINDLAREVAEIEPRTFAGTVVLARVLCAHIETEEYSGNRRHSVQILGGPLAKAVARLA